MILLFLYFREDTLILSIIILNFAHTPVPSGPVSAASARFGTPALCAGFAGFPVRGV